MAENLPKTSGLTKIAVLLPTKLAVELIIHSNRCTSFKIIDMKEKSLKD
jgi:hypothetical protein